MKLTAVEIIEIELPVKVFLTLDEKENVVIHDVESELDLDKEKLIEMIEDNDLLPDNIDWEPSDDEEDRYDELKDMRLNDYE